MKSGGALLASQLIGGFGNLFEQAKAITYTAGDNAGTNANLLSLFKVGLPAILGYIAMYCMIFPTGQEIVQTYASGNMIGTATMFSNDIYVPYIMKNKRDDKKEILVSRIVMVVVGLFGMVVALTGANIITVMMSAFALRSAGPFAAFVTGLFSKNVTYNGGFIGIIVGTIVAAVWQFVLEVPFGLSAIVPGGVVALIVILGVSAIEISRGVEPAPAIELTDN